jgi:hypothetical protein
VKIVNSGCAVAKALAAREWILARDGVAAVRQRRDSRRGEGKKGGALGEREGSFRTPMKGHGMNKTDRTNVAWVKPDQGESNLSGKRKKEETLKKCHWIEANPTKSDQWRGIVN